MCVYICAGHWIHGVCRYLAQDCCDGSDEYANVTRCPHVCEKEGEASRKELKQKVKMFEQGAVLRSKLVEEAAAKRAAWGEEKKRAAEEKLSLVEKEKQLLGTRGGGGWSGWRGWEGRVGWED